MDPTIINIAHILMSAMLLGLAILSTALIEEMEWVLGEWTPLIAALIYLLLCAVIALVVGNIASIHTQ